MDIEEFLENEYESRLESGINQNDISDYNLDEKNQYFLDPDKQNIINSIEVITEPGEGQIKDIEDYLEDKFQNILESETSYKPLTNYNLSETNEFEQNLNDSIKIIAKPYIDINVEEKDTIHDKKKLLITL